MALAMPFPILMGLGAQISFDLWLHFWFPHHAAFFDAQEQKGRDREDD